MDTEKLVHVQPQEILADDNSRFNLKKMRVDQLAANILEQGGVLTPVEVEPLAQPHGAAKYRLVAGFYRHAAVTKLNSEQGAGLTIPAIIRTLGDDKVRLMHQVTENNERENMSPMDQAVAIDRLLKAGTTRQEIRRMFSRPGGRKGNEVRPLSNAMLNIFLRFLELPKTVQEKIHDGRVGVAAAYELGKVPPEKRQAVIDRAEAERIKLIEQEEKDEEKYLALEKKQQEAKSQESEAVSALDAARQAVEDAAKLVEEKTAALRTLQKEPYLELDAKGKAALTEKIKAAEADLKGAQKTQKDAKNDLAKLENKAKTAAETAAEAAAKLDAARKVVKAKKADKGRGKTDAVSPADVKKAATAEGTGTGYIPLNASEMRQAIKDLAMGGDKEYPKTTAIARVVRKCIDGVITPKELHHEVAVIVGEAKVGPSAAAKRPAAAATATA